MKKVELNFDMIDSRLAELACFAYQSRQLLSDTMNCKTTEEWTSGVLMPFLDALQGRLREIAKEFHGTFRHIEHDGNWSKEPADIPPLISIEESQLRVVE